MDFLSVLKTASRGSCVEPNTPGKRHPAPVHLGGEETVIPEDHYRRQGRQLRAVNTTCSGRPDSQAGGVGSRRRAACRLSTDRTEGEAMLREAGTFWKSSVNQSAPLVLGKTVSVTPWNCSRKCLGSNGVHGCSHPELRASVFYIGPHCSVGCWWDTL